MLSLAFLHVLVDILQDDFDGIILQIGDSLVLSPLKLLPPFYGFDLGVALKFPFVLFLFVVLGKLNNQDFLLVINL